MAAFFYGVLRFVTAKIFHFIGFKLADLLESGDKAPNLYDTNFNHELSYSSLWDNADVQLKGLWEQSE